MKRTAAFADVQAKRRAAANGPPPRLEANEPADADASANLRPAAELVLPALAALLQTADARLEPEHAHSVQPLRLLCAALWQCWQAGWHARHRSWDSFGELPELAHFPFEATPCFGAGFLQVPASRRALSQRVRAALERGAIGMLGALLWRLRTQSLLRWPWFGNAVLFARTGRRLLQAALDRDSPQALALLLVYLAVAVDAQLWMRDMRLRSGSLPLRCLRYLGELAAQGGPWYGGEAYTLFRAYPPTALASSAFGVLVRGRGLPCLLTRALPPPPDFPVFPIDCFPMVHELETLALWPHVRSAEEFECVFQLELNGSVGTPFPLRAELLALRRCFPLRTDQLLLDRLLWVLPLQESVAVLEAPSVAALLARSLAARRALVRLLWPAWPRTRLHTFAAVCTRLDVPLPRGWPAGALTAAN